MRYSIEGQELTNIADALRRKHGETKLATVAVPVEIYDETQNYAATTGHKCNTFTIPNAKTIYVDVTYGISDNGPYFKMGAGEFTIDTVPEDAITLSGYGYTPNTKNLVFENTDTITIYKHKTSVGYGYGCYAQIYGCDENGNFVGDGEIINIEAQVKNTYESSEMAQAIDDIETDVILPEEAFVVSGTCDYRFAKGGWDWYIEIFGDRITTENIDNASYMFNFSKVTKIPFDINFKEGVYANLTSMFAGMSKLTEVPKLNNCRVNSLQYLFESCYYLRNIPEDIGDWFDWSYLESQTSQYTGYQSYIFKNCRSLRSVPIGFLNHGNPNLSYSYVYFNSAFNYCYVLDELVNLPIPYTSTWAGNAFSYAFEGCSRLKTLTFAMPNGQPYTMNWKSQTIDLSNNCGHYPNGVNFFIGENSGITADKEVKDDATYQALKDDPDWFATKIEYSRYNHDSAVATINSLPDTSAYLATAGGTNTIKFRGPAGSLTDGGAINTLTTEEIAVATAKGWTVTLLS